MPFSQVPPEIRYPAIDTSVWVVISRLTELPDRTVPSVESINHGSEFALPFPTGKFPEKLETISVTKQKFDDLGRPLYDNGLGGETVEDSDVNGNFYAPALETIDEDRVINLRDNPEYFTLKEVLLAVEKDFLAKFSFYDWAMLVTFDDRFDSTAAFADQQGASGFASGGHPFFFGPITCQLTIAASPIPRGHLLLIAPELPGVNWYWQRRHGDAALATTGPIANIEQASRLGEIYRIFPMENFPILSDYVIDADGNDNTKFWIRTSESGNFVLIQPYPVVPFVVILGRSSGSSQV